mgnify:CR=1 FL=1|jgi:hypothetical protein
MPPKKMQVIDLPVVGVIDLNDEVPMKTKKPKKVEAVVEMPVVEVVQEKPKKTRKVKSPVPEELELNRNYEEPVKESKPKAGNAWIAHIKAFALENGITYNKAMLDPRLKETYIKSTKGKVSL